MKKLKTFIGVTFQKKGYHHYATAPADVSYLRAQHRHLFKFKVSIEVFTMNRELEFHQFQNWLESLYESQISADGKSCEMLADELSAIIGNKYPSRDVNIEIWEDGECGAVCSYSPDQPFIQD